MLDMKYSNYLLLDLQYNAKNELFLQKITFNKIDLNI